MIVDVQANRQDGEDVEDNNAEEGSTDGAGNRLVRACALACSKGDELDAAVRVECIDERLRERAKAAYKRLSVSEVREAL